MFIIGIAIVGLINMLLWNALIPDIFHGPTITYLQAVGLSVLVRLLVGRGHGGGRHWKKWQDRGRKRWGQRWNTRHGFGEAAMNEAEWWSKGKREKWKHFQQMSPEEREQLKRDWACDFKRKYSKAAPTEPTEPK